MKEKKEQVVELLRQKAEEIISDDKNSINQVSSAELKRIMHELRLYHLELEMQNEELQRVNNHTELQKIEFANLFELAPIGYIVIDKTAVVKDANFAALQLLGVTKSYLQHMPFLLHVVKEDVNLFYTYYTELLLSSKSLSCSIRLRNASKEILVVKVSGIALKHEADNTFCYLTLTDITEKQQAEQKLKEAKTRLEVALSASLTGIWEIDIATKKVYLDDFCMALYGFDTTGFDEQYETLFNRVHPGDRNNIALNIQETIDAETPFYIRFRAVLPDQTIKYIQASARVITDGGSRKRFIGTFTDISEKTIMEMESLRIKEKNQQMILAAGLQAEENEKKRISEVLHNGIAQMLYAIKLNIDQLKKVADVTAFKQITTLLNQSIIDIRNVSFELAPTILTHFGLASTLEDMAERLSSNRLSISSNVINFSKIQNFQLQLNIFRIIQELVNNAI
ncbi:MAG: PAS domain S-box protein, partial [Sphingobacteriaceae bacterium]